MPLPFAAQAGIALAPTAIKGLNEVFNPSQASDYENKLANFMDIYEGNASDPVTENRVYRTGKREINARDKKNREQINNVVGAGNVTNEVKLAGMDAANETYAAAINRLMNNAQRYKEFSQGKVLQLAGMKEQAKQNRLGQRQQKTASWMGPLSSAANAFLMSDALGDGGTGGSDYKDMSDPLGLVGGR